MWITNSLQADWMCLLANTSQGKPHINKSLIIVPMNEPGVVKVRKFSRFITVLSGWAFISHHNETNLKGLEGNISIGPDIFIGQRLIQ